LNRGSNIKIVGKKIVAGRAAGNDRAGQVDVFLGIRSGRRQDKGFNKRRREGIEKIFLREWTEEAYFMLAL